MFGFVKAGLGYLFGGSSVENSGVSNAMTVAKDIGSFIDEQKFTDEEKSVANAKALDQVLEAVKLTRDENSTRSITRRVLAWMIMGSFILSFWIAIIQKILFDKSTKDVLQIVEAFGIGNLSLAVGSFYFMASLIRK